MKKVKRLPPALLLLCLPAIALSPALFSGCHAGYVVRQGFEQLRISWGASEIGDDEILEIDNEEMSEAERQKLALIPTIRRFAAEELELTTGDAYTTYYQLDREAISYTVTAAHPLAMVPYRWSFPIVGQVTYKGYFDVEDARAEGARLDEQGWDVSVTGAAAYSTLGWFRDPVLSTMLDSPTGDLVDLILHELTHRTIYFTDQTAINESLATVVARAATELFLDEHCGANSPELAEYLDGIEAGDARREILFRLRSDLDSLYRSERAAEAKLERKRELFATASRALSTLHPGAPPVELPASNAIVIAHGQYFQFVPLFEAVLAKLGGHPRELMRFLKEMPESELLLPELQKVLEDDGTAEKKSAADPEKTTRARSGELERS